MKRRHLFEFEDLEWFPKFLRNYVTDFLQFVSNKFDIYKPIVPILQNGLGKVQTRQIIDFFTPPVRVHQKMKLKIVFS